MLITPEQVRAARALLRLEQGELARRAQVSVVTIRRLEAVQGQAKVSSTVLDGVRQALEQAGAEFIADGVRKRRVQRPDAEVLYQKLRAISLRSAERLAGHETLTDDDLYDENGLPA